MLRTVFLRYLAASAATASLSLASALPVSAQTGESQEQEQEQTIEVEIVAEPDVSKDESEAKIHVNIEMPKLWLGIQLKPVEADLAKHLGSDDGIFVMSVIDGSPAEEAGIKSGDIILEAAGERMTAVPEILGALSDLEGEEPSIDLLVLRQGKEKTIVAKPTQRPSDDELMPESDEQENIMEFELGNLEGQVVRRLLNRSGGNGGIQIVTPGRAVWMTDEDANDAIGDLDLTIIKTEDGNAITVKVVKSDDNPAKVVVTEGDEVKEYDGEELDELPKKVRVIVEPFLKGTGRMRLNLNQSNANSQKAIAAMIGGDIDSKSIAEFAHSIAAQAAGHAKQSAEQAKRSAEEAKTRLRAQLKRVESQRNSSSEINELRELVNELKSELAKLRKQLDEDKTEDK